MAVAGAILALTYVGIAFTRLPWLSIDRPSAAFLGGVLMLLFGVLTFPEAVASIDFNTLALLLGMMVLVAVLQRSGFFTFLAAEALAIGRTPRRLLGVVVLTTAAASAFLVNDVVVLLFTPVVVKACRMMRVNPIPYLIGEAMAANIGSTGTIVGNPQNMLIGIKSGIYFPRFFVYLAPVALASSFLLLLLLFLIYRKDMMQGFSHEESLHENEYHFSSMRWSLPIVGLTILLFFTSSLLHLSVPLIALTSAALILLLGKIRPSRVIQSVDWVLLVFFGGLFVVIGGAYKAGVLDMLFRGLSFTPDLKGMGLLLVFSALASQVVSNVPLTMLAIPLIQQVPGHILWVSLAAGATLGGNMTLIGAVANIIVAEGAEKRGVNLPFKEFVKVGMVVTALTLVLAFGILALEYQVGLLR